MRKILFRLVFLSLVSTAFAFAHCDSLDGPVVRAAREALEAGNINSVLPWIPPDQESAVRDAFRRTASVRKLNPEAKDVADTWFFETVVRIHRAGEGAAYNGLKPAGSAVSPALAAADKAIDAGVLKDLDAALMAELREGLRERFGRVLATKNFEASDVDAGRRYVAAYVDFIHYAEGLEQIAHGRAEHEAHTDQ